MPWIILWIVLLLLSKVELYFHKIDRMFWSLWGLNNVLRPTSALGMALKNAPSVVMLPRLFFSLPWDARSLREAFVGHRDKLVLSVNEDRKLLKNIL